MGNQIADMTAPNTAQPRHAVRENQGAHPSRAEVAEPIDHRIDDVLGFVAAFLIDDGEQHLAGGFGDGVLSHPADDLDPAQYEQNGRERNGEESDHHDDGIEQQADLHTKRLMIRPVPKSWMRTAMLLTARSIRL